VAIFCFKTSSALAYWGLLVCQLCRARAARLWASVSPTTHLGNPRLIISRPLGCTWQLSPPARSHRPALAPIAPSPYQRSLVPTKTARLLSLNAPARISLALAELPSTNTNRFIRQGWWLDFSIFPAGQQLRQSCRLQPHLWAISTLEKSKPPGLERRSRIYPATCFSF